MNTRLINVCVCVTHKCVCVFHNGCLSEIISTTLKHMIKMLLK